MEFSKVVEIITLAKDDNASWLQYADDLVSGNEVDKASVPTYSDQCSAYQWLHDNSQELSLIYRSAEESEIDMVEFDIIDQIAILRYELQERYLNLFKHCLPGLNHAFFSQLFHDNTETSERHKREAEFLLQEMRRAVDELDEMLDDFQNTLRRSCKLNSA